MTEVDEAMLQRAIDLLVKEGRVERAVVKGKPGVRLLREKWQEARCPHTPNGVCLANCAAACRCQNGTDATIGHRQ